MYSIEHTYYFVENHIRNQTVFFPLETPTWSFLWSYHESNIHIPYQWSACQKETVKSPYLSLNVSFVLCTLCTANKELVQMQQCHTLIYQLISYILTACLRFSTNRLNVSSIVTKLDISRCMYTEKISTNMADIFNIKFILHQPSPSTGHHNVNSMMHRNKNKTISNLLDVDNWRSITASLNLA